ncbi:hypothetical protein [Streptomyces lydicus]|uniref:hypothetical protein n=1 Tax=Streptomyces lydicus TaxID=47763 RepID=UPI0037AB17AA
MSTQPPTGPPSGPPTGPLYGEPAPGPPPHRRPWWRTPPAFIGAAAAVVALAVGLIFAFRGGSGPTNVPAKVPTPNSSAEARDVAARVTLTPGDWGPDFAQDSPYEDDALTEDVADQNCNFVAQPMVDALAGLRRSVKKSDSTVFAFSYLFAYKRADFAHHDADHFRADLQRCQTQYQDKAKFEDVHEVKIPELTGFDEVVAEEGRLAVDDQGNKANTYYSYIIGRKGNFLMGSDVTRSETGQNRDDAVKALKLMLTRLESTK